jgi:predicted Ser/Thr protein kinase
LLAAAQENGFHRVRQGVSAGQMLFTKTAGEKAPGKHCGNLAGLRKSLRIPKFFSGLASWPKSAIVVEQKRRVRFGHMLKVKDTLRATVHLSFDGRVFKSYHGPDAAQRFANEVRVLRHLAARGCDFVPRLLEADENQLRIVTTNCGARVEHIDDLRARTLFAELEKFGVRHDDADPRNITYRFADGRFCLIDFEFATILQESKIESK